MKRPGRHAGIDLAKVLAAQCIVLHHFAWYGPTWGLPTGDAAAWHDWLAEHARLAVQVFLVASGYLAAQAIDGWRAAPFESVVQRHRRLAAPMAAMLVLAIPLAALVRPLLPDGVAPEPPTLYGLMAHLLLLQDVLRLPALSTGLWYVAIDFQLSVLLILLAWLMPGQRWLVAAVLALGGGALLGFNRHDGLDAWAPYFFGAYALGITAAWARDRRGPAWPLWAMVAMAVVALAIDWRTRVAVALLCALLLAGWPTSITLGHLRGMARLSRSSYALFLVHFPVFLLVAALFERWWPDADPLWLARFAIAWLLSMVLADRFERWIERPLVASRPVATGRAAPPAPDSHPGART